MLHQTMQTGKTQGLPGFPIWSASLQMLSFVTGMIGCVANAMKFNSFTRSEVWLPALTSTMMAMCFVANLKAWADRVKRHWDAQSERIAKLEADLLAQNKKIE